MDNENMQYAIKATSQLGSNKLSKLLNEVKNTNGVSSAEINSENEIVYTVCEWASQYDILTSILDYAEKQGYEVEESEHLMQSIVQVEQELVETESVELENEESVVMDEELTEEQLIEKANSEKFAFSSLMQRLIFLAVSAVFIVIGKIFSTNQMFSIFMLVGGFGLACYDVIDIACVKFIKKKFVNEEIVVLLIGVVAFYAGYQFETACLILFYSAFKTVEYLLSYKIHNNLAKLKSNIKGNLDSKQADIAKFNNFTAFNALDNDFDSKVQQTIYKPRLLLYIVAVSIALFYIVCSIILKTFMFKNLIYLAIILVVVCCFGGLSFSILASVATAMSNCGGFGISIYSKNKFLQAMDVDSVVLSKAGVLTTANYTIESVTTNNAQLGQIVHAIESQATHPIATALCHKFAEFATVKTASDVENFHTGVSAIVDNCQYFIGNKAFMTKNGIKVEGNSNSVITVFVADSCNILGVIGILDEIQQNSFGLVKELSEEYGLKTILYTGDGLDSAKHMKQQLGLTEVVAGCSDSYKIKNINGKNGLFVGDCNICGSVLTSVQNAVGVNAVVSNTEIAENGESVESGEIVVDTMASNAENGENVESAVDENVKSANEAMITIADSEPKNIARLIRVVKKAKADILTNIKVAVVAKILLAIAGSMFVLGGVSLALLWIIIANFAMDALLVINSCLSIVNKK